MNRLAFLPLITVCFCLGIWLVRWVHIPFLFLYILAWILLILSFIFTPPFQQGCIEIGQERAGFIKRINSFWLLIILAIILGGLFLLNTYILPYPHIRNFTFYKSEPVIVRGVVTAFPEIKANSSRFVLNAQELTWAGKVYPVSGRIQVKIFRKEDVSYTDQLILEGSLFRPYQAKDKHFSYRDYLENQGIYSMLTVSKNKPIRYLGKGRVNPLRLLVYKIRDKCSRTLFQNLPPAQSGIFSAMILGDRSKIPHYLRRLFVQTGTVHILAISGLHVGIVAFILGILLKAVRLKRRLRYLVIALLLILYCLLTGARPSVIRATIMAIVLLTCFLLRREPRISHSLSLAALIILTINPRQIFNLGFQLSFVSVMAIVYLSPHLNPLPSGERKKERGDKKKSLPAGRQAWVSVMERFFISGFSVSLSAWLVTLPFIAYYFRIISPITVLANLVVVPYLALVIALGLSLLIAGAVFPILVPVFALPASLSIVILVYIIKFFNQIPWAYFYL